MGMSGRTLLQVSLIHGLGLVLGFPGSPGFLMTRTLLRGVWLRPVDGGGEDKSGLVSVSGLELVSVTWAMPLMDLV